VISVNLGQELEDLFKKYLKNIHEPDLSSFFQPVLLWFQNLGGSLLFLGKLP